MGSALVHGCFPGYFYSSGYLKGGLHGGWSLIFTCMCGSRAGQAHGRQHERLAGHVGACWQMGGHALQRLGGVRTLRDARATPRGQQRLSIMLCKRIT